MKFAFMIMGQFDPDTEGVDCIELCGAFEEEGARRVIEATGNKVPVGYVVHLPSQDPLFQALFGK